MPESLINVVAIYVLCLVLISNLMGRPHETRGFGDNVNAAAALGGLIVVVLITVGAL